MAHLALRRTLGPIAALAVIAAAMSTGTAYAQDPAGTSKRPDGTRVTTPEHGPTGLNSGNENASVDGVGQCALDQKKDCWDWIATNGTPCPSSHFCIYTVTRAGEGGKIFALYHCREFHLRRWNGDGYYSNANTGGAPGYLKGQSHEVLRKVNPGEASQYPFAPVYYVQAC
ncbi:hypothetical protein [Actinomadura terrae]|uniref:hypothetical protein n=1 Tax=Actinomadura terrae TaxID=604353 RepID=UPI001FA75C01|nr:hypothetical protein [Actinomadura terrae]